MSFCDAKPVKIAVTKLTIPEKVSDFFLIFLTNIQIYRYGRGFDWGLGIGDWGLGVGCWQ